jgi:hypothetical protein
VIDVDGDRATQECSLLLVARTRDRTPVRLLTTGRYRDELVRTDEGWQFKRREAVTDTDLNRRSMPDGSAKGDPNRLRDQKAGLCGF